MPRPGPAQRHDPASHAAHPTLRLVALGVLVEVLWGLGLLAMLGAVSVVLWAVLNGIGSL